MPRAEEVRRHLRRLHHGRPRTTLDAPRDLRESESLSSRVEVVVRLSGGRLYRRNDDEIVNEAMVRGEVCVPPVGLSPLTTPSGGGRASD